MSTIIDENVKAESNSFLYYLHEEGIFDIESLTDLCSYINTLNSISIMELRQLYFIQNQSMRNITYHFDPGDCSEIFNLPENYWNYIDLLDHAISKIKNISI